MSDKTNMAGHVNDLYGKMNNKINMGNLLGEDWHLVEVQEREGECPGTREKVEIFKQAATGSRRTVVTQILSHRGTVFSTEQFPGQQTRISIRSELNCLPQDDPILLKEIRKDHLIRPSKKEGYNST